MESHIYGFEYLINRCVFSGDLFTDVIADIAHSGLSHHPLGFLFTFSGVERSYRLWKQDYGFLEFICQSMVLANIF